ncbi:hypothetical protein [Undibacterium sp. TS12]|uniref:hypothetical protein n=1 Tax=Undibacterium sp. TS12 TaxID=2908202 RepID=UPI001F4CA5FE|nr:hypothetical protein [Undibacterium sp. TS12]MCH8618251.1 hypothetical protein [Undibacterium sp. TS12]
MPVNYIAYRRQEDHQGCSANRIATLGIQIIIQIAELEFFHKSCKKSAMSLALHAYQLLA